MIYEGLLLTEEEKTKYFDLGLSRSAVNIERIIPKIFTFRGPEPEILKLLTRAEEVYGKRYTVKYVTEDIAETSFYIKDISFIQEFPMLKEVGFVLETDKNNHIIYAGVVYIPSGFCYPSDYKRLTEYKFDVSSDSNYKFTKSFMWPLTKSPTSNFTVRYKECVNGLKNTGNQVSLTYRFSYEDDWNDGEYIFCDNSDVYRLDKANYFDIKEKTLYSFHGDICKVVIPKKVKYIASGAFKGNKNISDVYLTSVKEIGNEAFADCINLKNVHFCDSLEKIGDEVFSGCSKLLALEFPDSVKSIGYGSFFMCGIEKVAWPKSIDTITIGTFRECKNLYSVVIPPEVVKIDKRVFGRANTIVIYGVPGSEAEKYANSNGLFFKPCDF